MGKYVNRTTMIDPDTGEVLKEKQWFGYDGFSDNGYKYRNRAVHIKYFFDSLPHNISDDALFLLFMIAEIMNEENVLVYRVKRKSKFSTIIYKPLDKEEIRLKTRFIYGINKFDKCWRELNKHCIKRVKYYNYYVWAVNPTVINKCREIPYWLCEEFKDYMTPHISAATLNKLEKKIDNLYN